MHKINYVLPGINEVINIFEAEIHGKTIQVIKIQLEGLEQTFHWAEEFEGEHTEERLNSFIAKARMALIRALLLEYVLV